MLIQHTGNPAQTPAPARPASSGTPDVSVAPSKAPAQTAELPQTAAQAATDQQASAERVSSAVENINQVLKQSNRNLEFSVDESTNRQVFKLLDSETGDVIRQYPTEEMLAISRSIDQVQHGLLLKQEA